MLATLSQEYFTIPWERRAFLARRSGFRPNNAQPKGLVLAAIEPYMSVANYIPENRISPSNSDQPRRRFSMALAIGDTAPDFEAETTEGKTRLHDWIVNNWVVLFSHPKDFTPVCTTELGTMARLKPEFDKRGVKIVG